MESSSGGLAAFFVVNHYSQCAFFRIKEKDKSKQLDISSNPCPWLRIAIQKSGRLAEPARNLLSACGLSWRESRDKLFCYGESLPVDLLLVRDDDIPGLIADGVCDLGIVGRNELDEQAAARRQTGLPDAYQALRGLGFGQCRLMLAVPEEWQWQGPAQLAGTRIATSYPAILKQWLAEQGVDAQVVELSGSVEIAPRLGTADLICDLVSSGATLRANQLTPVHNLLDSEAVLAGAVRVPDDARASLRAMLLRRLDGVVQRALPVLIKQGRRASRRGAALEQASASVHVAR